MKKTLIALVLCLFMVSIMAVPVSAAGQKVALIPSSDDPGNGFVLWNTSSGGVDGGTELTISLKGAVAQADYTVHIGIPNPNYPNDFGQTNWYPGIFGTMTTDTEGNATFHRVFKNQPTGIFQYAIGLNRVIAPGSDFTMFHTDFVTLPVRAIDY